MSSKDNSIAFIKKRYIGVGLGVMAAWVILVGWSLSPYSKLLDHTTIGEGDLSPMVRLLIFLFGWCLMMLAMMLPIELYGIRQIEQVYPYLSAESGFLFRYLFGYIGVWAIFGCLLYAGDSALHEAVELSPLLDSLSWGFAGVILVSAGIYQFTPWKQNCLRVGRSTCLSHTDLLSAWRMGWKHGLVCLGSCWGLMLIMFAIGRMNLAVALVFLSLVAAERFERLSRYATPLIGLCFVVWGIAGLLGG